jgi:hypothetical protein
MKHNLTRLLALSLLIALSGGSLKATTEIPADELGALSSSQTNRARFAERLAAFYKQINDDIPNLTPQEAEWLRTET